MTPSETKILLDLSQDMGEIKAKLDQAIIISNISPRTSAAIIGGLGICLTVSVKVAAGAL